MKKKFFEIDEKLAGYIIDNMNDEEVSSGHLYWYRLNNCFIGIDNSTGNAWTEEFKSRKKCFKWLRGEFEVSTK